LFACNHLIVYMEQQKEKTKTNLHISYHIPRPQYGCKVWREHEYEVKASTSTL
jgi:hypothetical protein